MTDESNRHAGSESRDASGWRQRTTPPVGSIGYTGSYREPSADVVENVHGLGARGARSGLDIPLDLRAQWRRVRRWNHRVGKERLDREPAEGRSPAPPVLSERSRPRQPSGS